MPCLARQFLDNKFLNDLGSKSLLRSQTNRDICIVYISSNFNIWLDLNSMATIPYFIDFANGSLLQSDYFFNCHRVSPHMYSIC